MKLGIRLRIAKNIVDGTDLLCEACVEQHPDLSAIFPYSLNTMRLITICDEHGNVRFERGFLRVGTGQSRVDNWYAGGLAIGLTSKGKLKGKGVYLDFKKPDEAIHPDTGIMFNGYQIPMFKEAVDLVLEAHSHCKELPLIGWDIATTLDGPVLIEANLLSGTVQAVTGGFRKNLDSDLLSRSLMARQEVLKHYE